MGDKEEEPYEKKKKETAKNVRLNVEELENFLYRFERFSERVNEKFSIPNIPKYKYYVAEIAKSLLEKGYPDTRLVFDFIEGYMNAGCSQEKAKNAVVVQILLIRELFEGYSDLLREKTKINRNIDTYLI